jgi:hypothetical protein
VTNRRADRRKSRLHDAGHDRFVGPDQEVKVYPLVPAHWLQKSPPPTYGKAEAEDRYYQAYASGAPRRPRSLVPLAAIVVFLALIADLWPH